MSELRSDSLVIWRSWGGRPESDLLAEGGLLSLAARGTPQLFTFGWNVPVLVLGYGQRDLALIDLEACERLSIPVVRRCSGGTGVLQGRDLNLSLALPLGHPWASGIRALYGHFTEALQDTLALFGVRVRRPSPPFPKDRSRICFESWGEETLLWGNRKVAGGAQVRRKDAVLVHLTALFSLDTALQSSVFKVPQGRILRSLAKLPPRPGLDRETLAGTFARMLAERLSLRLDERPGPPVA